MLPRSNADQQNEETIMFERKKLALRLIRDNMANTANISYNSPHLMANFDTTCFLQIYI